MTDKKPNRRRLEKMWEVGEALEEFRAGLREHKTERLQLRLTPTEKEEVEWITELMGIGAADYLMHLHRSALEEIEKKIDNDERREKPRGDSDSPRRPRRSKDRSRRKRRRGDGGAGVTAKI